MYSKYLGTALADKIKEAQEGPLDDLREEFGAIRVCALQAAQMYEVVTHPDAKADEATKCGAAAIMREAMMSVIEAAERISRVQQKGAIDPQVLNLVVTQMITLAHGTFGGVAPVALIQQFADEIKAIRMPRTGEDGTLITPDQDVIDMDSTIPMRAEAG